MNLPRRHEAGQSAHRQYLALRQIWRHRVRKIRRIFLGLGLVAFALVLSPLTMNLRLSAAAAAGVFAAMWAVVGDSYEKADRWFRGAIGERQTEDALRCLRREGWIIRHDLSGEGGNVDHVVIGPPGVFLLDSKRWSGAVTIADGVPVVAPWDEPESRWTRPGVPGQLKRQARVHRDALVAAGAQRPWVQPVAVLWASFDERVVEADRVVYVHGEDLADWLRDRTPRYSRQEIRRLGAALDQIPKFRQPPVLSAPPDK